MSHVLTLVGDRRAAGLAEAIAEKARAALPRPDALRWLEPGVAADIPFAPPAAGLRTLERQLRDALEGAPVDLFLLPVAGRRKKLLAADMDSTMIGQECIDELAAEVGVKDRVAAITERAMRGEIVFEAALRERVALLRGLGEEVVGRILTRSIRVTPGARALILTMRRHGARTALVSGGFTVFTAAVAERIGFDEHHANRLEVDDGRFTGTVAEPIFGADGKLDTLRRLREASGLDVSETLAVGDGANDLPMLREAGLGVAFHGKPAVAAAADARVDHADLTALLYAQGYARDAFAADP